MNLEEIQYKGWPAYELAQGDLALVLVPQVGGRLMGLRWQGQEIFFSHPGLAGHIEAVEQVKDVRARKKELGFLYWGGEKTWLAPQAAWPEGTPFLDLDSGGYDLRVVTNSPAAMSIQMASPVCRESGMQITRTLTVESSSQTWETRQCLTNASSKTATWGIWSVSMVNKPATVYLPRRSSSRDAADVKIFRDEGESAALRNHVLRDVGNLTCVDCQDARKFKYGVDSLEGWLLAVLQVDDGHSLVGYVKRVPTFPNQPYADDCTLEVYSSGEFSYFEMETLGPTVTLDPGQSYELIEKQSVFDISRRPDSEADIRRLVDIT